MTVTNPGPSPVSVPAITVSGPNNDFGEGDDCVGQIPGGGSCTINVIFRASVAAAESGQLSVGGLMVNLSGAGIDFSIAAASGGSLSVTVTQGQKATYALQVTANGGASPSDQVSLTVTCAGAPSEAFCSSTPQPVVATVNAPGALTVSVTTTAPTRAMAPPVRGLRAPVPPGLLAVIVVLQTLWLFARMGDSAPRGRRQRLAGLAVTAPMVLAIVLAVGCGGGSSSSPPPPVGGTPPGTYTLTLTGTAGGDTHAIQLTLIVNAD